MVVRLEYLEQLLEIGAHQSVTQAARKLEVSQPALSRTMSKLADELGVTLFEKTSHGIELTEAGRLISKQAEHILHEVEALKAVGAGGKVVTTTVRMLVGPVFYHLLAADLLRRFGKLYPHADLVLEETAVMDIAQAVSKGLCALGLVTVPLAKVREQEQAFAAAGLNFSKFMRVEFSLFVAAQSELAQRERIPLTEVSRLRLVDYEGTWALAFSRAGLPLEQKPIRVWDRETQKRLIISGTVAAILPDMYARKDRDVQKGLIKRIPITGSYDMLHTMIYFVYPDGTPLSLMEQEILRLSGEIIT